MLQFNEVTKIADGLQFTTADGKQVTITEAGKRPNGAKLYTFQIDGEEASKPMTSDKMKSVFNICLRKKATNGAPSTAKISAISENSTTDKELFAKLTSKIECMIKECSAFKLLTKAGAITFEEAELFETHARQAEAGCFGGLIIFDPEAFYKYCENERTAAAAAAAKREAAKQATAAKKAAKDIAAAAAALAGTTSLTATQATAVAALVANGFSEEAAISMILKQAAAV